VVQRADEEIDARIRVGKFPDLSCVDGGAVEPVPFAFEPDDDVNLGRVLLLEAVGLVDIGFVAGR